MAFHGSGTFEVKLSKQTLADPAADPALGRTSIEKTFEGDLQGASKGEMLIAGSSIEGSAAYVAIERVSGNLHGRSGSFVLQHAGVMNRGVPQLTVTVVPDSATGGLTGLSGVLDIKIIDGKHFYAFDYELPDEP